MSEKTLLAKGIGLSGEHLAIAMIGVEAPKNAVAKIAAPVNEDLLKNNKYSQGKKEYLSGDTLRRMLNEAFDYKWSWEVISWEQREDVGGDYVMVLGRLYLPGLGFRDAFGASKLDKGGKKDNSAAFASANTYAFKNAVKQTGFGASLFDDTYDDELWDEDFDEKPAKALPPAKNTKPADEDDVPAKKPAAPASKPADDAEEFTDKQKAAMAELREIYKIKSNKQLLGLFQIWDKNLKSLADVTPFRLDEFLNFYDKNEDLFEDYDPEEVL